jgi:hypothetical protein
MRLFARAIGFCLLMLGLYFLGQNIYSVSLLGEIHLGLGEGTGNREQGTEDRKFKSFN